MNLKSIWRTSTLLGISLMMALVIAPAGAEQYVAMDDIQVHYSAISTDKLPPAVARAYGITRSQSRAMLNVTVLRNAGDTELGTPINGTVKASATNLTGQRRDIDMRRIEDAGAIYYVGFVRVTDAETLDFVVDVVPDGSKDPVEVAFRQQFFVD